MKLKITVEHQMAAPPFRNQLSWFTALTFFLLCLGFLGFRFSSFLLTSIVLVMSMVYLTISKRNTLPIEKFVEVEEEEEEEEEEETFISDLKFSSVSAPTSKSKSPDLLSESECADDNFTTTEESEVEWPFLDRTTSQNPDYSDGSISDEESLIEIALPTGHYVSHKVDDDDEDNDDEEEDDDTTFHLQKLSDFQKHKTLVELLAEINDINEEENLIEIDISMGSIKYSRFEIKA